MPPFTYRALICLAAIVCTANPASAATKLYDSSADNGEPTDTRQFNIATSPTLRQTPDRFEGSQSLTDDGTGTVTLDALNLVNDDITDFGPETLPEKYLKSVISYYPEVRLTSTDAGLLLKPLPTHVGNTSRSSDTLRPSGMARIMSTSIR